MVTFTVYTLRLVGPDLVQPPHYPIFPMRSRVTLPCHAEVTLLSRATLLLIISPFPKQQ